MKKLQLKKEIVQDLDMLKIRGGDDTTTTRTVEVAVVYAQQKTAQQPVKNHALSSVMKCSHN